MEDADRHLLAISIVAAISASWRMWVLPLYERTAFAQKRKAAKEARAAARQIIDVNSWPYRLGLRVKKLLRPLKQNRARVWRY